MLSEDRRVLAVAGFVALCCCPLRMLAQSAPSLGNAASFAVLGGTSVTSSGTTTVTGNLGVSPGSTITDIPPSAVKLGDTFRNDALAKAAHNDAGAAYGQLSTGMCTTLSSQSPPPGIYCISSPALLTGALTLDAAGNHDAVWIFRITGTLTTDPNSCVLAINGAQPGNVLWQVNGSANLGTDSAFVGNLIAHDNITLNSRANAFGRLLALAGTVTLDTNNVTLCSSCNAITLDPLRGGTVNAPYSQTISASGGASYTFKVISGTLPPGIGPLSSEGVLSGTPTKFGTFQFTVAATDSQGCSGERAYTILIACPDLTLSPATLPDAKACVEIQQPITAIGGSGSYNYTSDDLPIELMLIPVNGKPSTILTGSVTIPGNYTFTVTAEDTATHCIVHRTYTLKVLCSVMVLPETLPPATTCASYCKTFTASCGTPPYTFSFSFLSGAPPAGLVPSPDGMLCGIPTTPGTDTVTVTATDARGCTGSRTYTFTAACHIAISPPALPNGSVNVPYSQQLTASCGTQPYTFTKVSGSFPPGFPAFALPSSGGLLSGTPTAAGVYRFRIMATDSNGCSGTMDYTLFICPPTILPPTLPTGTVGTRYNQPITAIDGSGSYTFSVPANALPPGLRLCPPNRATRLPAVISGTPTTSGSFTFTVTAVDMVSGCVGSRTYTIVVCGLTLSPAILSMATLGVPYNETITASGGTAPYTFSISGTLPPGLTFMQTSPTTAVISGTPTAIGTVTVCITVTDPSTPPCGPTTQCYPITVVAAAGGPTLSGWGMLVLSILLAGAALVMIRRGGLE
jgi:hypothetical protein